MGIRWTWLILTPLLLSACAVPRTVDSTVQAYSTLVQVPQPATYRLVELPSQRANPRAFAAVAPLAHEALARIGLQRDDAAPGLMAEIGVNMNTGYLQGPWYPEGPWGAGWHGRAGFGFGWGGGLRAGTMLRERPPTVYRHEVRLVLRDAKTQQTVYETSAFNEDIFTETPAIFGVLFNAALAGFPRPPEGPRQVRLPLHAPTTADGAALLSEPIATQAMRTTPAR